MIENKLRCPRCGKSVKVRIGLTDNGWTIECSACKEEADRSWDGINIKEYLENIARSTGDTEMLKAIEARDWNSKTEESK